MPNIYPVFDAPELYETTPASDTEYGKSWLFDFEKGEFVFDGGNRIKEADGHTAWAQWCVKAILTKRFAYLAYGPDFGSEVEDVMKQPNRAAVEAELERAITEALLADPRTEAVRDFKFTWNGDEVRIEFWAYPVVGNPEKLEVTIHG